VPVEERLREKEREKARGGMGADLTPTGQALSGVIDQIRDLDEVHAQGRHAR